MDRPLRILMLADSRAFHTERLVWQMRLRGCRVLPASLERGKLHHFHLRGHGRVQQMSYLLARRQVSQLIERFRPDVINAHFAAGYGHLAAIANRRHRVPLVTTLWGSDILLLPQRGLWYRRKTRVALEAANYVLADSQYLLDEAARLADIPHSRVIPFGVERSWLDRYKEDRPLHRPLRIIVPRQHAKVYNNVMVFDSLRKMIGQGRVELTFPDFGPLAGGFRVYVKELLERGVSLYPRLPREEYIPFMAGHDVYLSASRSDSSPASLLEAMAVGLVAVAADIPGIREWLTPQTGFVFRQDDRNDLRQVVELLLQAPDSLTEQRRRARERVLAAAVFEENVADMIKVMKSLS